MPPLGCFTLHHWRRRFNFVHVCGFYLIPKFSSTCLSLVIAMHCPPMGTEYLLMRLLQRFLVDNQDRLVTGFAATFKKKMLVFQSCLSGLLSLGFGSTTMNHHNQTSLDTEQTLH